MRRAYAAAAAHRVFYAQGVKANVLFFDRKPANETPWTRELWIYDLRTNQHFTLKTNPLTRGHLDDFVSCYRADDRTQRVESERFHRFTYDELTQRDKANLDIFWLRDDSLEDSENLPPPDVIAEEIMEDLRAALEQLEEIAADLGVGGRNIGNRISLTRGKSIPAKPFIPWLMDHEPPIIEKLWPPSIGITFAR